MNSEDENLKATIQIVVDKANSFKKWVSQHAPSRQDTDSPIPDNLLLDLGRAEERLEDLKAAVTAPPACALYGASQTGKSLLISSVIEDHSGQSIQSSVRSALGNPNDTKAKGLIFSKDLNPHKGVEATAVVTRFSKYERIEEGENQNYNAPVKAKVFSLPDLIKAMGLGFATECKRSSKVTEDSLKEVIESDDNFGIKGNKDSLKNAICEAYDYLINNHESAENFEVPPANFVDLLNDETLTINTLISVANYVFWDDWQVINNQFLRFYNLFPTLDLSNDELWLSWETTHFILDSGREEKFDLPNGFDSTIEWDGIQLIESGNRSELLQTGAGRHIPYRDIQAIIAELTIPIDNTVLKEYAQLALSKGDILDIPGAMASAGGNKFTEEEYSNDNIDVNHIIKRGKVNLFFEKYAKELQSTTLVYTENLGGNINLHNKIGPSIKQWGKYLYGQGWPSSLPEGMPQSEKSLVLCLTRITDGMMNMSPVNQNNFATTKLDRFHQANYEWFSSYGAENKPFNNTFIIRYPGRGDDIGVDTQRENQWREIFASDKLVEKHIEDFQVKWDACFSEDGGVENLLSTLVQSMDNGPKRKKIKEDLDYQIESLQRLIGSVYVDPSPQAEADKRRAEADGILEWLSNDPKGNKTALISSKLTIQCSKNAIRVESNYEQYITERLNYLLKKQKNYWSLRADGDVFDAEQFAKYLADYLIKECLDKMTSILENVSKSVSPNIPNHVYNRYVESIFNDFLLEPGPREEGYPDEFNSSGAESVNSVLRKRWESILKTRLASAVGETKNVIPDGNQELEELL